MHDVQSSGDYGGKNAGNHAGGKVRISMQLEGKRVSIGIKKRRQLGDSTRFDSALRGSSADTVGGMQPGVESSPQSMASGSLDMTIPERGSLLGNFNMRMRKINLEHANMNTRLALRGPEHRASLESASVTSSQAFAQATEAI